MIQWTLVFVGFEIFANSEAKASYIQFRKTCEYLPNFPFKKLVSFFGQPVFIFVSAL